MMTTIAALFGVVPLMFGTGTGAGIQQPLSYAIVSCALRLALSNDRIWGA
jgi:multidrug efflux pump subunit AcrB